MVKVASSQKYQEQVLKFRYLKEQYDLLQSQLEIINASRANLITTKNTLENIKEGVKEDEEILIPIGGIVNIKASIKEPEKVLLAVNQDVVIEKDLASAIQFLEKIIEQHNKKIEFFGTQLQNLDINLNKISQDIQRNIV